MSRTVTCASAASSILSDSPSVTKLKEIRTKLGELFDEGIKVQRELEDLQRHGECRAWGQEAVGYRGEI